MPPRKKPAAAPKSLALSDGADEATKDAPAEQQPEAKIKVIDVQFLDGESYVYTNEDGLVSYSLQPTHFEVQTLGPEPEVSLTVIPLANVKHIEYLFEKQQ